MGAAMSKIDSKTALETAIQKVAVDIGKIIAVVKRYPDLTEAQITKAFGYVGTVLTNAHQQALVAHQTAGTFSLDAELPAAPLRGVEALTAALATQTTTRFQPDGARRRAEGRMVNTKEVVFTDTPEPRPVLEFDASEKPDNTGGIKEAGFIED